jgi:thioesterase domain-containing protein
MTIRSLFEAPTVARLAARLDLAETASPFELLLPLRSGGGAPPLFCVHAASGLAWVYSGLLREVDAARPIYGLQARNAAPGGEAAPSVEAMASDYVQAVRGVQRHGPYHLLGWSFGGLVAHAMACRLEAAGERVSLTLLDSYPPSVIAPDELTKVPGDPGLLAGMLAAVGGGGDGDGEAGPDGIGADDIIERARETGHFVGGFSADDVMRLVRVSQHTARLVRSFTPGLFAGDVLFIEATGESREFFPRGLAAPRCWTPRCAQDKLQTR